MSDEPRKEGELEETEIEFSKMRPIIFPTSLNPDIYQAVNIATTPGQGSGLWSALSAANGMWDPFLTQGFTDHAREMEEFKSTVEKEKASLFKTIDDLKKKVSTVEQVKSQLKVLEEKERLAHLLDRVHESAQKKLLKDAEFSKNFQDGKQFQAYVLSIDIRRSTELMLKARSPLQFAQFISNLCIDLKRTIIENFGVFDKFTGDGILAFFPDFYSGESISLLVTKAAEECHELFRRHFKASRNCFIAVPKDAGLGIGIDFGTVSLVRIGSDITVVGNPVVYSCRFSGALAGQTLCNQPAFEEIIGKIGSNLNTVETEIDVKHEGVVVAYAIKIRGEIGPIARPSWLD